MNYHIYIKFSIKYTRRIKKNCYNLRRLYWVTLYVQLKIYSCNFYYKGGACKSEEYSGYFS